MKKENWIWMPHPGHFIGSKYCLFHLNTYVGGYIVSTVGELWWDSQVRKIKADVRNVEIEGKGDEWDRDYMKKIGYDPLHFSSDEKKGDYFYETMVFKAKRADPKDDQCCPWRQVVEKVKDEDWYRTADEAIKGHMAMCKKWAKKS